MLVGRPYQQFAGEPPDGPRICAFMMGSQRVIPRFLIASPGVQFEFALTPSAGPTVLPILTM
jgi:hypothetical protein